MRFTCLVYTYSRHCIGIFLCTYTRAISRENALSHPAVAWAWNKPHPKVFSKTINSIKTTPPLKKGKHAFNAFPPIPLKIYAHLYMILITTAQDSYVMYSNQSHIPNFYNLHTFQIPSYNYHKHLFSSIFF